MFQKLLILFILLIPINVSASENIGPTSPNKELARECVIQCNAHSMRGLSVKNFDKERYPYFSQKLSDTDKEKQASLCIDMKDAMDFTRLEHQNRIKAALKEGTRKCWNKVFGFLPENMTCQTDPDFLSSCHDQCLSIIKNACGVHLN